MDVIVKQQIYDLFKYSQFNFVEMEENVRRLGHHRANNVVSEFIAEEFTIGMFQQKRDINEIILMMDRFHCNAKRLAMVYSQFAETEGKTVIMKEDCFFEVLDTVFERIVNFYFTDLKNLIENRKRDVRSMHKILSLVPCESFSLHQKPINDWSREKTETQYKSMIIELQKSKKDGRMCPLKFRYCFTLDQYKVVRMRKGFHFKYGGTKIDIDYWVNGIESGLLHVIARMHLHNQIEYSTLSPFILRYFRQYSKCTDDNEKKKIAKEIRAYCSSPCSFYDRRELCTMQKKAKKIIWKILQKRNKMVTFDGVQRYKITVGDKILIMVVGEDYIFITAFY